MDRTLYKGMPLAHLRIDAVVWTEERAEHIRTRSIRHGEAETNLEPAWMDEALMDPGRVIAVAGDTEETSSVKVVGYSASLDALLKVWIWSDEPQSSTGWNGGSAAVANDSDRRRYISEGGA